MVVVGGAGVVRWIDSTPPTWKPRGTCPECRGVFALTTRGTLTPHRRADGRFADARVRSNRFRFGSYHQNTIQG
jgi:hypothetical protein